MDATPSPRDAGPSSRLDRPTARAERLLFAGLSVLIVVVFALAVAGVLVAAPRGGSAMTTPTPLPPSSPLASGPLQVLALSPQPTTPGQPARVQVRLLLPDACTTPASPQVSRQGQDITVVLMGQRPPDALCAQVVREAEVTVDLGVLEAGTYRLTINGHTQSLVIGGATGPGTTASPASAARPPGHTPGAPEPTAPPPSEPVTPNAASTPPPATVPPPGPAPTLPPGTAPSGGAGGIAVVPTAAIVVPQPVRVPTFTPTVPPSPAPTPAGQAGQTAPGTPARVVVVALQVVLEASQPPQAVADLTLQLPAPCVVVDEPVVTRQGQTITITVSGHYPPGAMCPAVLARRTLAVPLGTLPAGTVVVQAGEQSTTLTVPS